MDRIITPGGFEAVLCGEAGDQRAVQVHDFIQYGSLTPYSEKQDYDSSYRDMYSNVAAHRERHYPNIKHTIADLSFEGKTVVLLAPGPTAVECIDYLKENRDRLVIISMNQAIKFMQPDLCFIMERNARPEWIRGDDGVVVPWVPASPIVTCPDASGWLADIWRDNIFYFWFQFGEIPSDPRSIALRKLDAVLWSYWCTPTTVLHLAAKLGAAKIVLAGHDFAMDMGGNIYPGVHGESHPNKWTREAFPAVCHNGEMRLTTRMLLLYRDIVKACCYWIERNGTPVLNASPSGMLDWRPTPLEDAVEYEHQPIVDYLTGAVTPKARSARRASTASVRGKMARRQLQPA